MTMKSVNNPNQTSNMTLTPNKQMSTLNVMHRPTKSNFLSGGELINNGPLIKGVETARKLHDIKINNNPSNVTPNLNGAKNIMKINNFYEVVKNGSIQTNSKSARAAYNHKTEIKLGNSNVRKPSNKK